MKEYKRIASSLLLRLITAISAVIILAGILVYLFILSSFSDFAYMHIKEDLLDKSRDIYTICDQSLNELLKSGTAGDEKAVRIKKGLTIGLIEDLMRKHNLKGGIFEDGMVELSAGCQQEFLMKLEKTTLEDAISNIKHEEKRYYAKHIDFAPWRWHIVIVKDESQYSPMLNRVKITYWITGIIMLLSAFLSYYFLSRYVRQPISKIINPIKDSKKPEYKGIYEFEFLSDNIALMIDAIENEAVEKEKMKENLFQSQKMDAIGKLAGGIAHDFNNMLQGILGYASLIKMKIKEDDPVYKSADIIENSAMKAAELAKQLLGFARKGKYMPEALNLNDIAGDVLGIIGRTFDRAIEIRSSLDDNLRTVEVDRTQVENAILNLCINAKDAMPAGGVLTIKSFNSDINADETPYPWFKPGRYAAIAISDTGTGIDDEIKNHIFEPFFTTKEKGRGTGMGLAMVYGIVKNHNGFITVDSEQGKGSVLTVYLPFVDKEPKKQVVERKEVRSGTGTILVVDDEDDIRLFLKETLEGIGYRVIEAYDGVAAVDIYNSKKESIDLVILDLIMPKMGGDEAFSRLKLMNPDVKVVISTGYGIEEQTRKVMEDSGISGFIQKPYNVAEISETVRKAMTFV